MTPEELAAKEAADAAAANETPAWAQQLIDQNADLSSRLATFEEAQITPQAEVPQPVQDEDAWKPTSWGDVASRIDETAVEKAQAILDAREADAKAANDQQLAATQEIDKYLDDQVTELTKSNALPTITNENDPNDPGKLAQRELYGFALSMGTADLKSTYNTLDALHKAGKQFDFVKMELVDKGGSLEGQYSPVGSSNGGASSTPNKIDYKTIQNNSLHALADRFKENS